MISIKIDTSKLERRLQDLADNQVPFATAKALNAVAKRIQKATHDEMNRVFSGATPYALRSMKVKQWANKRRLTAIVGLRTDAPGKGTSWDKALSHQFVGGARRWKKFEAALMHANLLPPGMIAVPPGSGSWANPLNPSGNVSPGLLVQLLSYFNAFSEQGYRANMSKDRRSKLANVSRTDAGHLKINGVVYFASRGKGMWYGREQHLPPGIWAKRGTHGVNVAPVLLFVRRAVYRKVIDLRQVAQRTVDQHFANEFSAALRQAIKTAR